MEPKTNGHSNTYKVGMPTFFLRHAGTRVDTVRSAQQAADATGKDQAILRPIEPDGHVVLDAHGERWMLDDVIHPNRVRRYAGLPNDHMPWESE